jgi:4a-hydroxytetrahydrobiopterin dehydratase
MTGRRPLQEDEIRIALDALPGWSFEDNALSKVYRFGSFREAVSFIVRLSFEAEQRDHHPELLNVYNRVEVRLRTHDAGNVVTEADADLAQAIENLSWV